MKLYLLWAQTYIHTGNVLVGIYTSDDYCSDIVRGKNQFKESLLKSHKAYQCEGIAYWVQEAESGELIAKD